MGSIKVPRLNMDDFRHQVDNSTSTIQRLYELYCDPVLSDLQLIVGEERYSAHKLILSISSDVFKTMLTSPTWPEAYTDQIYLEEEPQCALVFEAFLQYLYTGKVHLSHTHVLPVLILADKYNIGDLSVVCVEYMCNHFVALKAESSVLSWLKYSIMCNHKNLEKACENYIMSNFQYILETDEFLTISSDMLIKFLRSSEIVIINEVSLFHHTLQWVQKNCFPNLKMGSCSSENLNTVKEIIALIRCSLITRDDLLSLQSSTKQIIEDVNKFIGVNCLLQQISEFSGEMTKLNNNFAQTSDPRIYTCDAWCTEMVVPNVMEVQPGEICRAFFSTPSSNFIDSDESWDWYIDLYPRGVLFHGCMMIGLYGNHNIDEVIYERVRLAVSSNISECRSVKITVLIYGHQNGAEFVVKALTKTCLFNDDCVIHHVNDLVEFNELQNELSPFLLGEEHNAFRIKVVIRPLS